uniref:Mating type protein MAT1-2-1 n=1 Tax=Ophiocordyceps sinensis TaxID=72228 RepID=V9LW10_9HYPO|nr:mating type protein MAT1-2-1 [Ophiocordyceps sinensis]
MANPINMIPNPQWNATDYEAIWKGLEAQVNPFSQILCLEGNFFRQLDDAAKLFIARKLMEHVQESVLYVNDGNGPDRVYLGAPRHFVVGGGMILQISGYAPYWIRRSVSKVVTATVLAPPSPKDIKIPRPPNAYILYRKERHHYVKDANPGITNNEISQILGKAWNMESNDVRQKYKDMSQQVKQALLEKHPDYQYKPRRPCERRRRRRASPNQNPKQSTSRNAATRDAAISSEDTSTATGDTNTANGF